MNNDLNEWPIKLEPPVYTAGQWVEMFYTNLEIIALMQFEKNILLQNKNIGPIMQSCKSWLESMMIAQPSDSFTNPPYTYTEASIEAIQILNS